MSITASGDALLRACDPLTEIHYALSERVEMGLRTVCDALIGLAQLGETPPDELGPMVETVHLAAIFRVLGEHTTLLLDTAATCTPAVLDCTAPAAQGGLQ